MKEVRTEMVPCKTRPKKTHTVKPQHSHFVLCREVVLFWRLLCTEYVHDIIQRLSFVQ